MTTDPRSSSLAEQNVVAERLQLQAMQDVPYCPLGQYLFVTCYRKQVIGVGKVFPTFWNVEKA